MSELQSNAPAGPGEAMTAAAILFTTARTLSDTEKKTLSLAVRFMQEFRKVRPTMPLMHAFTFVLVALNEGKSVAEYAQLADISQSVMTRNLLDLGERNRRREPGYGLVTQKMDPTDMRRHQTFLTPEGRSLAKRLVHTLG